MSYHREEFVRSRVKALAVLLSDDGHSDRPAVVRPSDCISDQRIDQLVRLLRPTTAQVQDFAKPVRIRIRQSLLHHPHTSNGRGQANTDAPVLLARFDKELETFQRMNAPVVNSFLIFMKPVSFFAPATRRQPIGGAEAVLPASAQLAQSVPLNLQVTNSLNKPLYDNNNNSNSNKIHIGFPTQQDRVKSLETDADRERRIGLSPAQLSTHWVSPETEKVLLVDLVYVLQGVTGKHIKLDTRSESFVIDPALCVSPCVRDLVLCICELGWLYSKVADFLKKIFVSPSSFAASTASSAQKIQQSQQSQPQLQQGLVLQAFGFALQEELHDYFRLLAVLEQELLRDVASDQALLQSVDAERLREVDVTRGKGLVADKANDVNAGLTLLRLKAWMQDPIERCVTLSLSLSLCACVSVGLSVFFSYRQVLC
jgi:hypothetical protein